MANGETIILQSWIKDSIIAHLRECGCDDEQVEECWNSFVASVVEVRDQLKQVKKTGNASGLAKTIPPFLDLVNNLQAVDLMIYTKNLSHAMKNKDMNALDRAVNDWLKVSEKYLDDENSQN